MFSGGVPAFCTVNGAKFVPRKPGPILCAEPPIPINPGKGNSFDVKREDVIEPIDGY